MIVFTLWGDLRENHGTLDISGDISVNKRQATMDLFLDRHKVDDVAIESDMSEISDIAEQDDDEELVNIVREKQEQEQQ